MNSQVSRANARDLELAVLRALMKEFSIEIQRAKKAKMKIPMDASRRRYCNLNRILAARSTRRNGTNSYSTMGLGR